MRWLGFDVYGTLLDVDSATRGHELPDHFGALWRAKQLEYTWTRQLIGAYEDFWALTAAALDFTIARTGVGAAAREELLAGWLTLEPFAEVAGALAALREGGARLAAISNGTPAMLARALEFAGLASALDEVVSVDEIRVYKPDARVYHHAAKRLDAPIGEITFVSAHAWDAAGARAAGMAVAHVQRRGEPAEHGFAAGMADLRGLVG
jgi:2-haloacid dehalogenase